MKTHKLACCARRLAWKRIRITRERGYTRDSHACLWGLGSKTTVGSQAGSQVCEVFPFPLSLINFSREMDEADRRKEAHLARKIELERQREEILRERERLLSLKNEIGARDTNSSRNSSTRSSTLSVQIKKTKNKIPEFERKVQTLRKENQARTDLLRKPYDGEMGIGTYEPWQLEDFYFVREFVRSWVDEVLDFIVPERPRVKPDYDTAGIAEGFFEELDVERKHDEILQVSLDIEQGILTDVIYQIAKETAAELVAFEVQTRTMLDRIILDSFDPRSQSADQRKISLLNNALSQFKKEALKKREVWSHSQSFHRDENVNDTSVIVDEEEDTFDGTVLHFHDITPFSDVPDANLPPEQVDFQNKESEFWMGNTVDLCTLPLPRRYRGISCTALSPDNSLIALGTVQGDIVIWDLATFPPRILRSSRGNNSAVVQLHWSFDSSQVVSLNDYGAITLWSLGNTISIPYEVKSFEPLEVNIGFKPSALIPLLTLERRDFLFTKGPFSDSRDLSSEVTAVAFHPSATLLGRQAFLMVGFSNGNILKLRFNKMVSIMSFPQVQPANGITHKIGNDVDAELFKEHCHKIVLITFVNNISPMVTVDEKGFINLWEYSSECLTGFGWFVPSTKYRLNMVEMTYEPVLGTQEKVEFTDEVKGPKHKHHHLR